MRTHATGGLPLPEFRTLLRNPFSLLDGLTVVRTRLVRETTAVFAAIHALPGLVLALERLGPATDSLNRLAETTASLEALARDTHHVPQVLGQLHALHEQVVAVACDLRALEPDIEQLAESAASLDQSIRVLARAFNPWRDGIAQDNRRENSTDRDRQR